MKGTEISEIKEHFLIFTAENWLYVMRHWWLHFVQRWGRNKYALGSSGSWQGTGVPVLLSEYRKERVLSFPDGRGKPMFRLWNTTGQPCPVSHAWLRYFIYLLSISTWCIFSSVGLKAFLYFFKSTTKWLPFDLLLHFIFISHCVNSGKLFNLS